MRYHNGLWASPLLLASLIIAIPFVMVGCSSAQKSTGLSEIYTAYNLGDHRVAFAQARQVADRSNRAARYPAAYIAGKAARQLNDIVLAERYLRIAAGSKDRLLSGEAMAELGLLYAEQRRFEQAANSFVRAASNLSGQHRANAFLHAGLAQQKLGRWTQARDNIEMSKRTSKSSKFKKSIADHLAVKGYTLQFGAFKDQSYAKRMAEQLAERTAAAKVGRPRLVSAKAERGSSLYLVQVGQFNSYVSASRARDLLEGTSIIVPFGAIPR